MKFSHNLLRNNKLCELSHYSHEELIGKNIDRIFLKLNTDNTRLPLDDHIEYNNDKENKLIQKLHCQSFHLWFEIRKMGSISSVYVKRILISRLHIKLRPSFIQNIKGHELPENGISTQGRSSSDFVSKTTWWNRQNFSKEQRCVSKTWRQLNFRSYEIYGDGRSIQIWTQL